jgi:hypothetical protein
MIFESPYVFGSKEESIAKNFYTVRRILGLMLIAISIFCEYGIAKKHTQAAFLHGEFLTEFYKEKIESGITSSDLAVKNLFKLAKNASLKALEKRSDNESIALHVLEAAINHFFYMIFHNSAFWARGEIPVLIFGGIMNAGGSFLKDILEKNVLKFNDLQRRLNLIFSEMGDERAILGAVDYALSNYKIKNGYAIGVDIGGTTVRMGLINLSDFSVIGELIKEQVFADERDKDKMKSLIPELKKIYKVMGGCNCLINNRSLEKQKCLRDKVIKKICNMISTLKKDYKIRFVAISSAGDIKEDGFFDYVCLLPFSFVNLKQEMESLLNVPVFVFNDIDCAAFGEKKFGLLKGYNNFIIAGLGTGVGLKYFQYSSNSVLVKDLVKVKKKAYSYHIKGDLS